VFLLREIRNLEPAVKPFEKGSDSSRRA